MPQSLGSIAQILGKAGPLVTGGLGVLGNILGGSQQSGVSSAYANYLKMVTRLASDPAMLNKMIKSVEQPLSTGLVENVMNTTQGQLAERGLSSSPQIATAVTEQALAPYEQQSQQMAIEAVMRMLGLPMGGAGMSGLPFKASDTSGLWKALLNMGSGTTASPDPGITLPTDINPAPIIDFGGGMPDIWGGYTPTMPTPDFSGAPAGG